MQLAGLARQTIPKVQDSSLRVHAKADNTSRQHEKDGEDINSLRGIGLLRRVLLVDFSQPRVYDLLM